MPTIDELKNSPSSRARPWASTVQTRLTSGTIASRNAPWTRQVTNRSVALREPSRTREVPSTTARTATAANTTVGNHRGSGAPTPDADTAGGGTATVSGARVGMLIGSL